MSIFFFIGKLTLYSQQLYLMIRYMSLQVPINH